MPILKLANYKSPLVVERARCRLAATGSLNNLMKVLCFSLLFFLLIFYFFKNLIQQKKVTIGIELSLGCIADPMTQRTEV